MCGGRGRAHLARLQHGFPGGLVAHEALLRGRGLERRALAHDVDECRQERAVLVRQRVTEALGGGGRAVRRRVPRDPVPRDDLQ